jgi:hypothetical protein
VFAVDAVFLGDGHGCGVFVFAVVRAGQVQIVLREVVLK